MTDFKRTGTFSYSCLVTLPAGTWTAASQLRNAQGHKIADLVVGLAPTTPPDEYQLTLSFGDPSAWPLGLAHGDVVFTDDSPVPIKIPTGTFSLNIIEGDTR